MKIKAIKIRIEQKTVATVGCSYGDRPLIVRMANIPHTTILRAHVSAKSEEFDLQWQLPDLQEGQVISFQIVNVESINCTSPQFVTPDDL